MPRRRTSSPSILVVGARGIPDAEGGAEKNAEALFPRIAGAGYDVTLMGLRGHIGKGNYRGVKLLAAPNVRLLNTDKIAYYFTAVIHALILRPDIVHLQGLGSAIFLWVYKLLGHKVVVRYGSADYTLSKWGPVGRLGFLAAEWQLRYADAVISVTPALSKRLAQKGISGNVHTIPNALDPVGEIPIDPIPPPRPYLLVVGRVTGQKNVTTLLSAFAQFSACHPDYDLLIAGGLDDVAYVRSLIPLRSEKIKFLGRVPRREVPQLLVGASLFVNVSLHEGSSNATLEAISHGRPVLLSSIAENLDLRLPDHVYVSPSDPQAIAARLAEAVADPLAFTLERDRFLTWDQVHAKTLDVYAQVLPRPALVPHGAAP